MKGVWGKERRKLKSNFYSSLGPGGAILEGFKNFK
jgi:hypothetical protein